MDELWVALIAAGAAVAGAAVGGWFARSAGIRQAEAAKHAGDRQADALLHTVQATLNEERRSRTEERRRQTYIAFLEVTDNLSREPDSLELFRSMNAAMAQVSIEGPQRLAVAAHEYGQHARTWDRERDQLEALTSARLWYIESVRSALGLSQEPLSPVPFDPLGPSRNPGGGPAT